MTTSSDLQPSPEGLEEELDGVVDEGYDEEDEEFATPYPETDSESPSSEPARGY